jgi:transcriptional regulator with XRE-family HTH domain
MLLSIRDRSDLSDEVREARRRIRLTQGQLAKKVGSTQPQISLFENGQRNAISEETAERLVDFLELRQEKYGGELLQLGICTNPDCIGAKLAVSGRGEITVFPMVWEIKGNGTRSPACRYCNEVVVSQCETCKSLVLRNVVYCECRTPYVMAPPHLVELPSEKRALAVDEINRRNRELLESMSGSLPYLERPEI